MGLLSSAENLCQIQLNLCLAFRCAIDLLACLKLESYHFYLVIWAICSYLLLMQTPVYTIASNAGVEGAVVVGKLLEESDPDKGYDAAKGQ